MLDSSDSDIECLGNFPKNPKPSTSNTIESDIEQVNIIIELETTTQA